MDKSTLLNEIVNHANFKPMMIYALTEQDYYDYKNADFYTYAFDFYSNKISHIPLDSKLIELIADKIALNFDVFSRRFLKHFADHPLLDLYRILAWLESDNGLNREYANFAAFLRDFNYFNADFQKCLACVYLDHRDVLSKYFAGFMDDQAELDFDKSILDNWPLWQELKNDCVQTFDFEINCYANVMNTGAFVAAMDSYLNDKGNSFGRNMSRRQLKNFFSPLICQAINKLYVD